MTFFKALAYFSRTAALNLLRSWKVSLVAVLTIGVSLFVGGAFAMVSGNVAEVIRVWRDEVKVVAYLSEEAAARENSEETLAALADEVGAEPWVTAVEVVGQEEALARFQELFPSLSEVATGWGDEPLPLSLEIAYDPAQASSPAFAAWRADLEARDEIGMVDDDQDWLAELETLLALGRGLGLTLGLVLLAAAVFTIASVVRLTAYLYHDEISIMRLVGATEFFIRGPFYVEGLLQGLLGGGLAAGALYGAFQAAQPSVAETAWARLILDRFLSPGEVVGLVLLGALAGLVGAVLSLRREKLGQIDEEI